MVLLESQQGRKVFVFPFILGHVPGVLFQLGHPLLEQLVLGLQGVIAEQVVVELLHLPHHRRRGGPEGRQHQSRDLLAQGRAVADDAHHGKEDGQAHGRGQNHFDPAGKEFFQCSCTSELKLRRPVPESPRPDGGAWRTGGRWGAP